MGRGTAKASIRKRMLLYLANLPDPMYAIGSEELTYRSWSRSTVLYLIREVEKSDADPALVVSEFIKKVDRRSGLLFRVAYDVSVDLYDHVFL